MGIGTATSLGLAFGLIGNSFDVGNMRLAAEALTGPDPLGFYSELNQGPYRYPYPPGFFAWLLLAEFVADSTPLPFHGLVQIPMILANLGLALIVQAYLGARGRDERTRLLSAGAVVLGPVFVGISGYHVQLDALAILPAVVALVMWEGRNATVLGMLRPAGSWGTSVADQLDGDRIRRAITCGILIGIGAAIKTVPMFMLVALLPSARGWREAVLLVSGSLAVPLLLLTPFLIADPGGVETLRRYQGLPGLGGLSLVAQPALAADWLVGGVTELNAVSDFLYEHAGQIVLLVLASVYSFLIRFQREPVDSAVLVWVAFFALAPNFFFQYLIWGIPFFLMAGHVRATLILQAAILVPMVISFLAPWPSAEIAAIYVPIMLAVWAGFALALFQLVHRSTPRRRQGLIHNGP